MDPVRRLRQIEKLLGAVAGAVIVGAISGGVLTGAVAERRRERTIERLSEHFIICGYGRVGQRVADELPRLEDLFAVAV